jgi:hypothetical protein
VAEQVQPLDAVPLIRRKRAGEGGLESPEISSASIAEIPVPPAPAASPGPESARSQDDAGALRMKPRETVQLAAVHVRIPEQLARGLRLMSVLEGRQAQVIVAEMLEEHLTRWNPRWRDSVPSKDA